MALTDLRSCGYSTKISKVEGELREPAAAAAATPKSVIISIAIVARALVRQHENRPQARLFRSLSVHIDSLRIKALTYHKLFDRL